MLALVFNQPQGGDVAPPPPPPPDATIAAGGGWRVVVHEGPRELVTARQERMRAPRAWGAGVVVRAGAHVAADGAAAVASGSAVRATGAAWVLAQPGAAMAAPYAPHASGVHNPTAEELLVLAHYFPGLLAKSRRIVPLDRDRFLVAHAREAIRAHTHSFLSMLQLRLTVLARGLHATGAGIVKAAADDHDHEVATAADDADFDPLRHSIEPHIVTVARDAARLGLEQVADGDMEAMLSQVNERATAWAQEHAGELVTAIAETTRERVRELVAQAIAEGWSNDDLGDALAGAGVFAESRAEMIARTETAYADVSGNLMGWKESGVVAGKEWAASAGACDICAPLDGMVVGLDEEFPVGDPPAHPRCECDLLPVLSEGGEE